MENALHQTDSKRMLGLWTGILMTLASVILYAVGAATGVRGGLWIASVVVGAIAAIIHVIVGHSAYGGVRMTAMACLVIQTVFITMMATVYFGAINSDVPMM